MVNNHLSNYFYSVRGLKKKLYLVLKTNKQQQKKPEAIEIKIKKEGIIFFFKM